MGTEIIETKTKIESKKRNKFDNTKRLTKLNGKQGGAVESEKK